MALEPHRNRFYEVFEPHCKWNTFETFDIDLKGFKMAHIKVQINHNKGMLVVHGERPLGGTSNNDKWTRFHKTIKLSEDSNPSEIRAKFSDGVLSIQVPKQVKQPVNDVLVVGEGDRHNRRDWGTVKMNSWGAMKAAVLTMVVVTVGVTIGGAKSVAPPRVLPNKEEVVVDRAVKEPENRPRPGFNFRF